MQPRFFARPADFRRWLERNAVTTSSLVVGFRKVGSGRPSMSWPESVDEAQLTTEEQRAFRRDKVAWKYFESAPAGYRRTVLHWINAARRPETRVRRLEQLIAACAEGKRL